MIKKSLIVIAFLAIVAIAAIFSVRGPLGLALFQRGIASNLGNVAVPGLADGLHLGL